MKSRAGNYVTWNSGASRFASSSAAADAVANGASVIVLEANSFLGGAAGTSMGNILHMDQELFSFPK